MKSEFRRCNGKLLSGENMRAQVCKRGHIQRFPQHKKALSTRFPQILWIKLGKSGKVPKIRMKSNVSGSVSYSSSLETANVPDSGPSRTCFHLRFRVRLSTTQVRRLIASSRLSLSRLTSHLVTVESDSEAFPGRCREVRIAEGGMNPVAGWDWAVRKGPLRVR